MTFIPKKLQKELENYSAERKERFLKYYGKLIYSYLFVAKYIGKALFFTILIMWVTIYWILAYKYKSLGINAICCMFFVPCLVIALINSSKFYNKIGDIVLNRKFKDYLVLTKKEWKIIKKGDKDLFNVLRSIKSQGNCYDLTLKVVDILNNPDIKIIWLINENLNSNGKDLYGHAVLKRDNRIYDTTVRESFDEEDYYYINNSKVFKELSIMTIMQKGMNGIFEEFDVFEKFCESNGAKVAIED